MEVEREERSKSMYNPRSVPTEKTKSVPKEKIDKVDRMIRHNIHAK